MHRLTKITLAAIGLTACPSVAFGQTASGGIPISVSVPEVCQIEALNLVGNSSGFVSGTAFELCNSGRGFRVMATHRSLENGERVTINYAGMTQELDSSGVSDVAERSSPIVGPVPVSIQSTGLVQGLAISLGVAVI